MWLSRKNFLMLAACALASATYGCSNVEKASDPGSADTEMVGSSADSVGSIPEDLLAKEEKGQAAEGAEASTATESSDPFSDLKESDKKEENAQSESTTDPLSLGDNDSSAGSGKMDTYTVKSGDTLMKVAFTIYGDIDRWKDLQQWNNGKVKKASALSKGMKLKYEVPLRAFEPEQHAQSYVIKKGDTLANIADEVYGRKMKFKKLQSYNAKLIRNPNRIFAGFTIFYDITAKEIAEAEARRQERMAGGGGAAPIPEANSMVPSAIAPPAEDLKAPAPIAVAPTTAAGQPPAPASTTDMAPPPPPPAAN